MIGTNDLARMAGEVVALLSQTQRRLATAESCTGGLVSAALTSVPGSSDVFGYGFVTYANQAKADLISVPQTMLDTHGAVSPQVAQAMAEGALARAKADLAVAITGIAGPGGGSETKPVGLVFIAIAQRATQTEVIRHNFSGERHAIRVSAATAALDHVAAALKHCAVASKS